MKRNFFAPTLTGLLLFVNANLCQAQATINFPDTAPQRGVAPVGAYDFDQLETIDKATGTLSYTIPLTSMPLGRGGMTVPINLTYNSSQFDYTYSYTYGNTTPNPPLLYQQLSADPFGGWSIDPGYHFYVEYKPVPTGSMGCSNVNGIVRTSLVMPNGTRHVLYFPGFPQGFTGAGDGYFPWGYSGITACPNVNSLTGPFHLFTTDGSYISLTVPVSGSPIVLLPNGTTISMGSPEVITDRNGNKITIAYTTPPSNPNLNDVTLTDDLNRSVLIQQNLTTGVSTVTQTGYGGTPLTWTFVPPAPTTTTAVKFLYQCQGQSTSVNHSGTFTNCYGTVAGGGASTLQVPSNTSAPLVYTFVYGAQSGLLQTATLPSGASTTYTYACMNYPACFQTASNELVNSVVGKTRTWKDTADNGSSPRTESWSYAWGSPTSGPPSYTVQPFIKTAPDQGVETTYVGVPGGPSSNLSLRVVEPNGDSVDTFYQNNRPHSVAGGAPNPYVAATVRNLQFNGQPSVSALTLYTLDKNGNELKAADYDWSAYSSTGRGAGGVLSALPTASGTLLRTMTNAYTVTTAQVAGSGSETPNEDTNGYWNPSAPTFLHLLASSSVTGGGVGSLSGYTYSGTANPLSAGHWDWTKAATRPAATALTTANASVTNWTWDSYGNLKSETNPNGIATTYTYDSQSLYLAQKVQASGTSVARTFSYLWDHSLGVLTLKTDVDNGTADTYGYDAQGRQTSVTEGAGAVKRETQTSYNDAGLQVTVQKDQGAPGDGLLKTVTTYDELYRAAETQEFESASDTSGIKVQTRYLYKGSNSYKLVSNPFRAATSGGASSEPTMGWTLTTFDQNGRATASQSLSGSGLPGVWGGSNGNSTGTVTTAYGTPAAPGTRVTDQVGNRRDTSVDGLGRLASVTEYPATGSYTTTYSYDVLGDLSGVSQSGQSRTFVYDSLKRLIASKSPENNTAMHGSGLGCVNGLSPYSLCYAYDSNGNLTSKIDNRGEGVGYAYDPLNRILSKTYFNTPKTINYLAVQYAYDQSGSFSKGLLTSVATPAANTIDPSTTNYLGYDALGRVLASNQITNGNTYTFSYAYNLAGGMTSETYPSGRAVTTCYDGASRVSQVALTPCGNTAKAYASNFLYAAHGAATQYVMGNNIWHKPSFNSRLQMAGFSDSLNNTGTALLSGTLSWGTTGNNGNLQSATYVNGGPGYATPLSFTQTFAYDTLNRLATATDSGGWSRSFAYDAFGNMTPSGTPAPPTESFNISNQIVGGSYDQVGDQLLVNGNMVAYDFENRLTNETDGVTKAIETYVFDGNGNRVEKYNSNNRTVFVYDVLGRMAAEYSSVTNGLNCVTCYLTPDHLGTPRLITDQNGALVARHDYLPFGEEVAAGAFGRDTHFGAGGDTINQKFTGKERDSESGLDYFGARFYGSALGRFTSPDEIFGSWDQHDPQTFNLYGYVRNNPLRYTDPDGHDYHVCVSNGNGGQNCFRVGDDQYQVLYNQQNGQQGINLPGGPSGGNITCGGTNCGSVSYTENSLYDPLPGAVAGAMAGDGAGFALKGAFRGIVSLFVKDAGEEGGVVIGKMTDLKETGALKAGERELDLPNLNDPKANWAQNSSRLREAMNEGKPIRDASAEPLENGNPGKNTGFLRAERNLLENHGWSYRGGSWYPPSK